MAGRMHDVFSKTNKVYLSTLSLIVGFSVFILFSLALMPLLSSYVNVGGGFVRFSSFYLDITPVQAVVFLLIGLVSLLSLAIFLSALISIVKLRETLDHFGYSKVAGVFKKYVIRVFVFLLFLSILSIASGTILDYFGVTKLLIQLIIFALWLPLLFTPQILILENLGINEAIKDSVRFMVQSPLSLVAYVMTGFLFLLALTIIETGLGQYFVWEHKLFSIVLVSVFVLPYLQMFATELYVRRYPVAHT